MRALLLVLALLAPAGCGDARWEAWEPTAAGGYPVESFATERECRDAVKHGWFNKERSRYAEMVMLSPHAFCRPQR